MVTVLKDGLADTCNYLERTPLSEIAPDDHAGEPAALARQQTRIQLPDECTDSSRAPELAWRASCGVFSVYEGAVPLLTTPCWVCFFVDDSPPAKSQNRSPPLHPTTDKLGLSGCLEQSIVTPNPVVGQSTGVHNQSNDDLFRQMEKCMCFHGNQELRVMMMIFI